MARYSTSTSIYLVLPGLANTDLNTQLIQLHADRISGMIGGYVGARYSVSGWTTASATPQMIQSISDRLASQATMRSLYTQDAQNANEWVNELGEQALEELKMIAKGELAVIADSGSEAARATLRNFVRGSRKDYTPVFDLDDATSWVVDPDLLTQINSDRT